MTNRAFLLTDTEARDRARLARAAVIGADADVLLAAEHVLMANSGHMASAQLGMEGARSLGSAQALLRWLAFELEAKEKTT